MNDYQILIEHFFYNDDLVKLFASAFVGAVIGGEREYHSKSAGLRTFTLICLGSTIFTILSEKIGNAASPDRISANIVTGVGFIGAGIIFKVDDRVKGLTTAAIIWITAALGMAIGDGHILLSFLGAIFVFIVLQFFYHLENTIHKFGETRNYRIVVKHSPEAFHKLENTFTNFKMQSKRGRQLIEKDTLESNWTVRGKRSKHEKLIKQLFAQHDIIALEC
jgi:putative Mg2+ transporter-C (MgtC) family protein